MAYCEEVIEYQIKCLPKIHLNKNKNLQGNLGTLLILLESPWQVESNESDLEKKLDLKVWEILNFE